MGGHFQWALGEWPARQRQQGQNTHDCVQALAWNGDLMSRNTRMVAWRLPHPAPSLPPLVLPRPCMASAVAICRALLHPRWPPCPPPPAVALQALDFVRNPPRPQPSVASLLAYCQLCVREVQVRDAPMLCEHCRLAAAAAASPPAPLAPTHLTAVQPSAHSAGVLQLLSQRDPVSMASLMLSHGSLMWLSDAASPDNTVRRPSLFASGRACACCKCMLLWQGAPPAAADACIQHGAPHQLRTEMHTVPTAPLHSAGAQELAGGGARCCSSAGAELGPPHNGGAAPHGAGCGRVPVSRQVRPAAAAAPDPHRGALGSQPGQARPCCGAHHDSTPAAGAEYGASDTDHRAEPAHQPAGQVGGWKGCHTGCGMSNAAWSLLSGRLLPLNRIATLCQLHGSECKWACFSVLTLQPLLPPLIPSALTPSRSCPPMPQQPPPRHRAAGGPRPAAQVHRSAGGRPRQRVRAS